MIDSSGTRSSWRPTVVIDPLPDESAGGLLIRYCQANGWPSLLDFANQQGLSIAKMRWGEGTETIEEHLGLAADALEGFRRRKTGTTADLCGHRFKLSMIDGAQRRVCAECLHEGTHQKAIWELSFVDRCPVHKRTLSDRCGCGGALLWQNRRLDRCDDCETMHLPAPSAALLPSAFQHWFVDQMEGKLSSPAMLDSLDVPRSVEAINHIGLLVTAGYLEGAPSAWAIGADPCAVMEAGFSTVNATLEVAVGACVAGYRAATGIHVPKRPAAALWWFGTWLNHLGLNPGNPLLEAVRSALEIAFGWPVPDINLSEFVPINEIAIRRRTSVHALAKLAQQAGFTVYGEGTSTCVSIDFLVPH